MDMDNDQEGETQGVKICGPPLEVNTAGTVFLHIFAVPDSQIHQAKISLGFYWQLWRVFLSPLSRAEQFWEKIELSLSCQIIAIF